MKTYTDKALALAVYQIAAARMQAAGCEMPCSAEAFAVISAAAPDAADYSAMAALRNPDFLDAAYILLLGREVDAPAKASWQAQFGLPETVFRTNVLTTILRSAEYQRNPVPLTGCPLPLMQEDGQNLLIAAQAMPERLVRLYQKMPRPVQKLAKKLAGKE